MGAPEQKLIDSVLSDMPDSQRLFRINAGTGWIGNIVKHTGKMMVIENPRPLHGAPKGWPDLFGWESVKITPEMVGQTIAIAKGIECKATGNLSAVQKRFGEILSKMGGLFSVAR